MGSTPRDDKTLLLNPRHILSVYEFEANDASRSIICSVKMVSGDVHTVRNSADYIYREANKEK